jgi:DNA-binding MarR family transcriptional regulator
LNKEDLRISMNIFLKLYFDSCKEVYNEINFERITGKQFKYLKAINEKGQVTLTELADQFSISKPTVNEFINKMHKTGILKKKKSNEDKRVTYISLTEIGKVLATTNKLEGEKLVSNLQSLLSEEDLITISTIFNKIGVERK